MATNTQLEKLERDLERLIKSYSKYPDPAVRKIVARLIKIRKVDYNDIFSTSVKIIWLTDRIHELIDQISSPA